VTEKNLTETAASQSGPVGSLHFIDGRGIVRMNGLYDTHIDDLWAAVTLPARLARWIAAVSGQLEVGGRFTASFTSGWDGPGTVRECDAPRRLVVTLDADGEGEPETTIEARLSTEGDATRLIIEESGFSQEDLAAHGAGWQAHVEDLVTHLVGGQPGDWSARWTQLSPVYDAMSVEQN
jgi:uncharacterized protein YndB with AHSA1/START domain